MINTLKTVVEGRYLYAIKDTNDKSIDNIMLNRENIKAFIPKSGMRQVCQLS